VRERRRTPLRFFALVIALSVPIWVLDGIVGWSAAQQPFNLPLSSVSGFCPLIAALIVLEPRERRFLLRRLLMGVRPRAWYVPVLSLRRG
jgi:hypothetical protein